MITTLPQPTDIRGLGIETMGKPRRIIAYRAKPRTALIHTSIVEPYVVVCPRHRGKDMRIKLEATATGAKAIDAMLAMADQMFERNVDPVWLCPDCCGQIRWWLGGTSS